MMLVVLKLGDGDKPAYYQVSGRGEGERLTSIPTASGADCLITVAQGTVKVEGRLPYEYTVIVAPNPEDGLFHDVFELEGPVYKMGQMRVFAAALAYAAKVVERELPNDGQIIAWSNIDDSAPEPCFYKTGSAAYAALS